MTGNLSISADLMSRLAIFVIIVPVVTLPDSGTAFYPDPERWIMKIFAINQPCPRQKDEGKALFRGGIDSAFAYPQIIVIFASL